MTYVCACVYDLRMTDGEFSFHVSMIYLFELYYIVRDATSMCDDIAKERMGKNNWMKCPKKQSKYRQRVFIKLPL